jgi:hypothetical protein
LKGNKISVIATSFMAVTPSSDTTFHEFIIRFVL